MDLKRRNKIIARILPVGRKSSLKVKDLNRLFSKKLPSLGEDALKLLQKI